MIVTVVYVRPDAQHVLATEVAAGATVAQAIAASGLLGLEPELRPGELSAGVWNRVVPLDTPLQPGDRVEVYRPLTIDPKEARRLRAQARRR